MQTKALGVSGIVVLAIGVATASWAAPRAKPVVQPVAKPLIGVWQASPSMAAGWSNAYQFFADGQVKYHVSQMDCASRLRGWSGRWRMDKGKISFFVRRQTRIVGGRLQKATGSCGTPMQLVGGRRITTRARTDQQRLLTWNGVRADESNGRPMTMLGAERLWKYSDNPRKYP